MSDCANIPNIPIGTIRSLEEGNGLSNLYRWGGVDWEPLLEVPLYCPVFCPNCNRIMVPSPGTDLYHCMRISSACDKTKYYRAHFPKVYLEVIE